MADRGDRRGWMGRSEGWVQSNTLVMCKILKSRIHSRTHVLPHMWVPRSQNLKKYRGSNLPQTWLWQCTWKAQEGGRPHHMMHHWKLVETRSWGLLEGNKSLQGHSPTLSCFLSSPFLLPGHLELSSSPQHSPECWEPRE